VKLSTIGEFGLIRRFSARFLMNVEPGTVGIGDDCAVLPWTGRTRLLVTTDMLIEGTHFLRGTIPARDLGYKSLAVNLSDIAAMGGTPRAAFLSLGIPGHVKVEWLDAFFGGFRALAGKTGVSLLGGDTTKSSGPLVINLALLGEARAERIKYRSGAAAGDFICVTGFLGDSGGGLLALLEHRSRRAEETILIRRHNRPRPHLEEGAWLAGKSGVSAMMDVSDGIDSDLRRIMERSRCGARIKLETLPVSGEMRRAAKRHGWDPLELAAAGGEDYCLIVTLRPESASRIGAGFKRKFGRPLARIGTIEPSRHGLRYVLNGKPASLARRGFDHFK
jgi:thiamine-monophosphate kinase